MIFQVSWYLLKKTSTLICCMYYMPWSLVINQVPVNHYFPTLKMTLIWKIIGKIKKSFTQCPDSKSMLNIHRSCSCNWHVSCSNKIITDPMCGKGGVQPMKGISVEHLCVWHWRMCISWMKGLLWFVPKGHCSLGCCTGRAYHELYPQQCCICFGRCYLIVTVYNTSCSQNWTCFHFFFVHMQP